MRLRPVPSIETIQPYIGGDVLPQGITRRINLASNENVYGCSEHVKHAMREQSFDVSYYPPSQHTQLRETIAHTHGLKADHILCGNGSEDLIHVVCRTYAMAGDEVIIPRHGFLAYSIAAKSVGAVCVYADQPDYSFSVEAILACVSPRTRIVFIDNPANPLGCILTRDDLIHLHKGLAGHVLLVLDEAYAEYVDDPSYESGLTLFQDTDNVIVLRTASKIYGLASLRLGFAWGPSTVLGMLNRVRAPFNVNGYVQRLGGIAYRDQDWVQSCYARNADVRRWCVAQLQTLGVTFGQSHGNFLTLHMSTPAHAERLYDACATQGVIVRNLMMYDLPQSLRMTLGTQAHMCEVMDIVTTNAL